MARNDLTDEQCHEALRAYEKAGNNQVKAAQALDITRPTFQHRLREARRRALHLKKPPKKVDEILILKDKIRAMDGLLRQRQEDALNAEKVRSAILKLAEQTPEPPAWLVKTHKSKAAPGVPTLMLSDLHWGEVVDPSQIGYVNEYNVEIANQRLRACVTRTIDLLTNHVVNPSYPGIVLILGGDMVTGDIHEELTATNDMEIMPTFVDLFGAMIWAIETLADAFGHVFVPCVTGNHGRNTHKIRAKGRNFTSFDWLLYVMLEKHFKSDKRVSFLIPNGPDALYRIYNHRYLLTHGDQFRGGDGQIGAIGPLTRGNKKKLARNTAINKEYDTMLCGHWHQYMPLHRQIINGSLKGYDEYANANNFEYEPPIQALWLTHPDHGITISMPVYVSNDTRQKAKTPWVSVPEIRLN